MSTEFVEHLVSDWIAANRPVLTMPEEQQMVAEFMTLFEQATPSAPKLCDEQTRQLRLNLIQEEYFELCDATREEDLVETADALCDLLYVVYGTAVAYGIPLKELFAEVHRSNISKFWTTEEVRNLIAPIDNFDGLIHVYKNERVHPKLLRVNCWTVRNDAGKIIKSPSYSPARIHEMLAQCTIHQSLPTKV